MQLLHVSALLLLTSCGVVNGAGPTLENAEERAKSCNDNTEFLCIYDLRCCNRLTQKCSNKAYACIDINVSPNDVLEAQREFCCQATHDHKPSGRSYFCTYFVKMEQLNCKDTEQLHSATTRDDVTPTADMLSFHSIGLLTLGVVLTILVLLLKKYVWPQLQKRLCKRETVAPVLETVNIEPSYNARKQQVQFGELGNSQEEPLIDDSVREVDRTRPTGSQRMHFNTKLHKVDEDVLSDAKQQQPKRSCNSQLEPLNDNSVRKGDNSTEQNINMQFNQVGEFNSPISMGNIRLRRLNSYPK